MVPDVVDVEPMQPEKSTQGVQHSCTRVVEVVDGELALPSVDVVVLAYVACVSQTKILKLPGAPARVRVARILVNLW